MKQFILKNIVLTVILALTLIGSVVLMVLCDGKRRTIAESMATIEENAQKIESINSARKPNSVAESETKGVKLRIRTIRATGETEISDSRSLRRRTVIKSAPPLPDAPVRVHTELL